MAEILVKAIDSTHPDSTIERQGCYKRGMPVAVMPDGHQWGRKEKLPAFVVIKIPGVSPATVQKYIEPEVDAGGDQRIVRKRKWIIRWEALPPIARSRLAAVGELTIKALAYTGRYHYTWQQVKNCFRNQQTLKDETEDI